MAFRLTAQRSTTPKKLVGRCCALLLLISGFYMPLVQAEASLEYRVKAAFLYNFTKFVDWPAASYSSSDAPLEICIFGNDPFNSALDATVSGKSVNNHRLQVRRIKRSSDMSNCKVVYFGSSEHDRLREHLSALQGKAVLTVSDAPEFLKQGGMVRFLIVDGKVRFEISRGVAAQAKLTVSSKLLSVAHAVINGSSS